MQTEKKQVEGAGAASKVVHLAEMPVRRNANGSESRDVLRGVTATGDAIGVHESTQPKGMAPNPAHAIEHTEFVCVREGELEFVHDGRTERAVPGDILLVTKGTTHQLRNVGDGPASYFVVAIGGDAAPRNVVVNAGGER